MKKVLIVDDNVDILTVVQLILGANGFQVESISKWQALAERLQTFKPDIVLLDIALGTADGRELCKRIKQDNNTAHIPVILFSANYNLETSYSDYLANGFIPKPFETRHLVDTLKKHVDLRTN